MIHLGIVISDDFTTDSEDQADSELEETRTRSERYTEKLSKVGLGWLKKGNGRKVTVSVQNVPKENIVELSTFR